MFRAVKLSVNTVGWISVGILFLCIFSSFDNEFIGLGVAGGFFYIIYLLGREHRKVMKETLEYMEEKETKKLEDEYKREVRNQKRREREQIKKGTRIKTLD